MFLPRKIIDRTLANNQGMAALSVAETLQAGGEECFWVGGAVRDMAMGKMPIEIDMAVSARPEKVATLFKKFDLSAAGLGAIIVSVQGHTFELTTYREDDTASDGRHPESVMFGTRAEDALRRDATINAIYWNPLDGTLDDPTGGMNDLKEKLVRFIGDPETRIRHDALRLLRMIRLRATIHGQYEPKTYKALVACSQLSADLSGTRILQELEKMLRLENPEIALEDLLETGILQAILPEVYACKGVPQPTEYHQEGDVWEHVKLCVASCTTDHGADVRLAAFFHDIGKAETFALEERIRFDKHAEASAALTEKIMKRFQVSNERKKKMVWLIEHHMMMGSFQDLSETRKAHWYFHPWFQELLQLFWLDIAGTTPSNFDWYDKIIKDYNLFLNSHPKPQKPLLNGEEIMKILSLEPGAKVGEILEALHEAQIRKKVTSKAEAKDFLKNMKIN